MLPNSQPIFIHGMKEDGSPYVALKYEGHTIEKVLSSDCPVLKTEAKEALRRMLDELLENA